MTKEYSFIGIFDKLKEDCCGNEVMQKDTDVCCPFRGKMVSIQKQSPDHTHCCTTAATYNNSTQV